MENWTLWNWEEMHHLLFASYISAFLYTCAILVSNSLNLMCMIDWILFCILVQLIYGCVETDDDTNDEIGRNVSPISRTTWVLLHLIPYIFNSIQFTNFYFFIHTYYISYNTLITTRMEKKKNESLSIMLNTSPTKHIIKYNTK